MASEENQEICTLDTSENHVAKTANIRDLEFIKVPSSCCRHTSMPLAGIQKLSWIPARTMLE
ncbi:MAG: hypothetical protein KKD63_12310 [Proteobacteria bacterium]|nr:hypothetical protein [Desulfobulbaceae bacterium]MBU4153653.1 hypothetical protein [Pseudomonadota bacterium]